MGHITGQAEDVHGVCLFIGKQNKKVVGAELQTGPDSSPEAELVLGYGRGADARTGAQTLPFLSVHTVRTQAETPVCPRLSTAG